MDAAWIGVLGGLAGVLLGSGLSELFRRSNRIENYASRVFDKRMQIYENLFRKLVDGQSVAEQVMNGAELSTKDRHSMISAVILDIAEYCDTNELYLNDEVALHCFTAFMGAEKVADIKRPKKQGVAAQHVRDEIVTAKRLIKEEAGIERLNRFFGRLTQAKLSSPMIEHYRSLSKSRKD